MAVQRMYVFIQSGTLHAWDIVQAKVSRRKLKIFWKFYRWRCKNRLSSHWSDWCIIFFLIPSFKSEILIYITKIIISWLIMNFLEFSKHGVASLGKHEEPMRAFRKWRFGLCMWRLCCESVDSRCEDPRKGCTWGLAKTKNAKPKTQWLGRTQNSRYYFWKKLLLFRSWTCRLCSP